MAPIPIRPKSFASLLLAAAAGVALCAEPVAEEAQIAALKQLSLEELTTVRVSALSRTEEEWWRMPGAISVITAEEIRRSAALTLPDALRLGAAVHVAQSSERSWAVGVRGFNVLAGNKLAVLMDGRSLYTPLFSGVLWDAQDTVLEDIERIEIARGPVGSLWGTYAVNGFIQVFTKPAWDTQGSLVSVAHGTQDPLAFSVRHGGAFGRNSFYRIYAKYLRSKWTTDEEGVHQQPETDFFQTGFRVDSLRPYGATLTWQGDFYTNKGLPRDRLQTEIDGANVLGRWRRYTAAGAELTLEGYVDFTTRIIPATFSEERRTASVSAKFRGERGAHDWLLGVDALVSRDRIGEMGFVSLEPARETFHNLGLFVQDTYTWRPDVLRTTVGFKLEENIYTGLEWSPTARVAWTPDVRTTWWAAVSRAVRSPVRVDRGLLAQVGDAALFAANSDYDSETVVAWELGWRRRLSGSLIVDVAAFHNDYDRLRSNEPLGAEPFPRTFRNTLDAESHGVEVTTMLQPTPAFLLKGSYRFLDLDFTRAPGSRDVTDGEPEGNDPRHLLALQAHVTLPGDWEFDAYYRHASQLPRPATPAYSTLDLRLGWRPAEHWEIALIGANLLREAHRELITPSSLNEWVPRSLTLKLTCRY